MNTHALKDGEKAALQGMFHLLLLGGLKLLAGVVSGMTVLIADAISTFSDILGLFASYIGLHLSRKSATKNFEYGFYKIETFAALIISLGIIYLAYIIMTKALTTFHAPVEGSHYPFAITTTLVALALSYRLYKKLKIHGEKANSLALKANAKDKLMDIFAEGAVLVSIIANYKGLPYVEGIITMIIALLILKIGITSAKESLFFLLDYWNDPILVRKIRKILLKEKDLVIAIKKLRLRRAGTYIFGEAFIEINPFAGIIDLREELNMLSEKIKAANPYIKDFSLYTHISKSDSFKVAVPIEKGTTLKAQVANSLKRTQSYLFAEIKNNKISGFYVRKLKKDDRTPLGLTNFLKAEKIQILIDNKLNSLIYYNLRRTNHILVYPNFSDLSHAKQTLELLLIDT